MTITPEQINAAWALVNAAIPGPPLTPSQYAMVEAFRELVPQLLTALEAERAKVARLVEVFDHLTKNCLQDEHDEPDLCVDDDHWSAIHDAFALLTEIKETDHD